MYEQRSDIASRVLKHLVEGEAKDPGYLCRTFVRSAFSPEPEEFDRIQNEYHLACQWVKQLNAFLDKRLREPLRRIDPAELPKRPPISDGSLADVFRGIDHQLDFFNENVADLETLREKSRRSDSEKLLVYLGPFFLAIALAIRFTKVTGEIRLEQKQAVICPVPAGAAIPDATANPSREKVELGCVPGEAGSTEGSPQEHGAGPA
jgi:hypothetical protein